MLPTRPIPNYLGKRLKAWRATGLEENRAFFAQLAARGQSPRAMIITCCDSRIDPAAMFSGEPGDFFLVRNVANLVPPFAPDHDHHGTSAAIEYAVRTLHIAHILVIGHSGCGGVEACHDMCSGNAPELAEAESFIGRWMDILRPGFDNVRHDNAPREEQLRALEQQGVLLSVANLMTFPFVRDAVDGGELTLHGLWMDIASGSVLQHDGRANAFATI